MKKYVNILLSCIFVGCIAPQLGIRDGEDYWEFANHDKETSQGSHLPFVNELTGERCGSIQLPEYSLGQTFRFDPKNNCIWVCPNTNPSILFGINDQGAFLLNIKNLMPDLSISITIEENAFEKVVKGAFFRLVAPRKTYSIESMNELLIPDGTWQVVINKINLSEYSFVMILKLTCLSSKISDILDDMKKLIKHLQAVIDEAELKKNIKNGKTILQSSCAGLKGMSSVIEICEIKDFRDQTYHKSLGESLDKMSRQAVSYFNTMD